MQPYTSAHTPTHRAHIPASSPHPHTAGAFGVPLRANQPTTLRAEALPLCPNQNKHGISPAGAFVPCKLGPAWRAIRPARPGARAGRRGLRLPIVGRAPAQHAIIFCAASSSSKMWFWRAQRLLFPFWWRRAAHGARATTSLGTAWLRCMTSVRRRRTAPTRWRLHPCTVRATECKPPT